MTFRALSFVLPILRLVLYPASAKLLNLPTRTSENLLFWDAVSLPALFHLSNETPNHSSVAFGTNWWQILCYEKYRVIKKSLYTLLSSSSSSSVFHAVGPPVDPFRSHVSRSLFKSLPWFLLPVTQYCFITMGNLLRSVLFTRCIQFLLYSSNLSKIWVIFNSFAICVFVL
jgi:hypothetical protein